jgi:hypothetical protein
LRVLPTATVTRINEKTAAAEPKAAWSVVVVYEDATARERAVDFCDQLVQRFWARFEFDVGWWSFGMLQQEPAATEAVEKAAKADLVLLASGLPGDFPVAVEGWVEAWLRRRGDREGLLAGLIDSGGGASGQEARKHNYLRRVAHRAAMDYLTQVPHSLWRSIPESLDSYSERAGLVGSVLDEILHHPAPPQSFP